MYVAAVDQVFTPQGQYFWNLFSYENPMSGLMPRCNSHKNYFCKSCSDLVPKGTYLTVEGKARRCTKCWKIIWRSDTIGAVNCECGVEWGVDYGKTSQVVQG